MGLLSLWSFFQIIWISFQGSSQGVRRGPCNQASSCWYWLTRNNKGDQYNATMWQVFLLSSIHVNSFFYLSSILFLTIWFKYNGCQNVNFFIVIKPLLVNYIKVLLRNENTWNFFQCLCSKVLWKLLQKYRFMGMSIGIFISYDFAL